MIIILLKIALYITLFFWVFCWVLFLSGGCSIEWGGEEHWKDDKCEMLYYKIAAPSALFSSIVTLIIAGFTIFCNI